jgi:hypothetical protein
MIDPGVTLSAVLALEPGASGTAALIGNGGAFILGEATTLAVGNALGAVSASLFAADSLVNHGLISVNGDGASLDVVVDLGAITGQAAGPAPRFDNFGTISVSQGGSLTISGTEFGNAGSIMLDGGILDVAGGNVVDTGYVQLEHAAYAQFSDGVEFQNFDFGIGGGTISLADPWIGPGVTLANFGAGDEIVVTGQQAVHLETSMNAVTLINSSGTVEGTLSLAAPLAPGLHFAMVKAATGSAIIAEATTPASDPPCFASGTGILTPCGYRPVETLAAGGKVVTASGSVATVIWVGLRRLDIAMHPRPDAVRPIRILPGALDNAVPRRMLRLSPDHALFLDGVLIPVKHLVNGATILREDECQTVTYHHIELARHQLVLAEGAPCETYLDTGNRASFANAPVRFSRSKCWDADAYAPLCTSGPMLRAARQRLLDRALSLGFRCRIMNRVLIQIGGRAVEGLGPVLHQRYLLPRRHDGQVSIHSPWFVPAEFDASSADGRRLGIALSAVTFERRSHPVESLILAGFHLRAPGDASLWTNGIGKIMVPDQARSLTLHINALPRAWAAPPQAWRRV